MAARAAVAPRALAVKVAVVKEVATAAAGGGMGSIRG